MVFFLYFILRNYYKFIINVRHVRLYYYKISITQFILYDKFKYNEEGNLKKLHQ